jgi:hypothetical protein
MSRGAIKLVSRRFAWVLSTAVAMLVIILGGVAVAGNNPAPTKPYTVASKTTPITTAPRTPLVLGDSTIPVDPPVATTPTPLPKPISESVAPTPQPAGPDMPPAIIYPPAEPAHTPPAVCGSCGHATMVKGVICPMTNNQVTSQMCRVEI